MGGFLLLYFISQAFRRLKTYLPFLRDQLPVTQIWEEVKNREKAEKPLKLYEGEGLMSANFRDSQEQRKCGETTQAI